jgi:D-glycero-alpha-D-manno-heptose 1-phosphate guanylyltransferase
MKNPAIDFPALLLAGGLGTRLRSALPDLPKPLAPVRGRPFLAYLLDHLANAGWTRCVLCLGYKADKIIEVFGDRYGSMALEYSVENEPLGTGGALRLALPKIQSSRFLLLNADSYCDAPLVDFVRFHAGHGKPASLVAVDVPDTSRYGRLELAPDGRILVFAEKKESASSGPINAGIYLFATNLVESIPEGRVVSLEREMFPQWMQQGLMAWRTDSAFIDIGTPESYSQVENYLSNRL